MLPIHSLQIVRYGHLVLDAYFFRSSRVSVTTWHRSPSRSRRRWSGGARSRCHPEPGDVGVSVAGFKTAADVRKQQIRLRHLLTNSSGWTAAARTSNARCSPWWRRRTGCGSRSICPCARRRACVLRIAARFPSAFCIDQPPYRAGGGRLRPSNLFAPLGITDVRCPVTPKGSARAPASATAPYRLAESRLPVPAPGEWDGRRIVSRQWIEQATRRQIETPSSEDYGFGWWVSQDLPGMYQAPAAVATTHRVPAKDIVVVMTAGGSTPLNWALVVARGEEQCALRENPVAHSRLLRTCARRPCSPDEGIGAATARKSRRDQSHGVRMRPQPTRSSCDGTSILRSVGCRGAVLRVTRNGLSRGA